MGLIGSFFRLIGGIILFIVVLVLGIAFGGPILSALGTNVSNLPGTVTIGNVQVPLLASIVASLVLTLLINLIALPFRRNSEA